MKTGYLSQDKNPCIHSLGRSFTKHGLIFPSHLLSKHLLLPFSVLLNPLSPIFNLSQAGSSFQRAFLPVKVVTQVKSISPPQEALQITAREASTSLLGPLKLLATFRMMIYFRGLLSPTPKGLSSSRKHHRTESSVFQLQSTLKQYFQKALFRVVFLCGTYMCARVCV